MTFPTDYDPYADTTRSLLQHPWCRVIRVALIERVDFTILNPKDADAQAYKYYCYMPVAASLAQLKAKYVNELEEALREENYEKVSTLKRQLQALNDE